MTGSRIRVLVLPALVGMVATVSPVLYGSDSLDRYRELKQVTLADAAQSNGDAARQVEGLSETSTIEDYLVYAALHNPGIEAAFDHWKAALEKSPRAQSLPDPRFTYAYYIEHVETRVGP